MNLQLTWSDLLWIVPICVVIIGAILLWLLPKENAHNPPKREETLYYVCWKDGVFPNVTGRNAVVYPKDLAQYVADAYNQMMGEEVYYIEPVWRMK